MGTWIWLGTLAVSLLSGGVGGWIGSYLNLDVAIRKARSVRRGQQIDLWRNELLADWVPAERTAIPATGHAICQKPAYDSLRPHLSDDLIRELEGEVSSWPEPQRIVVRMDGDIQLRRRVVAEIGVLEKAWKVT